MPRSIHLTEARRRLQTLIGQPLETADAAPEVTPVRVPRVEFVAYTEDCLLSGYLDLHGDRLTDFLNDNEQLELVDLLVQEIISGQAIQVARLLVTRDELLLVHAFGPRGNRQRRIRTRQHPVGIQMGPYHVRGYIHASPGSDPIAGFRRRRSMVPITDAWIEYPMGGRVHRQRVGTLVVNRQLVDWIVEAIDDEVEIPDIPLSAYPKGPLIKDFTGQLHVD
jgi:hypothetical protein